MFMSAELRVSASLLNFKGFTVLKFDNLFCVCQPFLKGLENERLHIALDICQHGQIYPLAWSIQIDTHFSKTI